MRTSDRIAAKCLNSRMAFNNNLIHFFKDQRYNVSNNRYKVCLIFHFNKKVYLCFHIVDLKILTYLLTKPFNINKETITFVAKGS